MCRTVPMQTEVRPLYRELPSAGLLTLANEWA